jgi:hypothetical protein
MRFILSNFDLDKKTILTIYFWRSKGFHDNWQDSFTLLPSALSDKLLDPISETLDLWRKDKGYFVPTNLSQFAQDHTEASARIILNRYTGFITSAGSGERSIQKDRYIDPQ